MRAITILTLAALGACSAASEEENKAEPIAAASIDAGLWEVDQEVTSVRPTDHAARVAIPAKAGDKSVISTCVEEESRAKPVPALFAGAGYECKYRDSYIKDGRLTATLKCALPGHEGDIMMSVDGSYTGTSLEANVSATSYFPGDGDFQMDTRITGKRIGDCPANAAAKG